MQIPLFGIGLHGRAVNLSQQRRVNIYLEVDQAGDKSKISAHPTPGLTQFADFGVTPIRAIIATNEFMLLVHRRYVYRVANDGASVQVGDLDTHTGEVGIASNGIEVIILDGVRGYVYTLATGAFATISDPQFPNGAYSVAFLNGRFIVAKAGTGEFWFSDPYNAFNWQSTSFATAESNPDLLVAVITERGVLGAAGERTIEVYSNVDTFPVPYQRIDGATQELGLAARGSITKVYESIMFLGKNRSGTVSVYRMYGFQIQQASPPDMDFVINKYPTVVDAEAYAYTIAGHPMYVLTFPSATLGASPSATLGASQLGASPSGVTWMYDAKTTLWSQLVSLDGSRHIGRLSVHHGDRTYVSHYSNGKLYYVDPTVFTHGGEIVPREMVGGHIHAPEYDGLNMHELRIDIETGVALAAGQGSDPQLMLDVSYDRGHSFSAERWTSAGKTGEYSHLAVFDQLGPSRDCVFKLRVTEPVNTIFLGAALRLDKSAS